MGERSRIQYDHHSSRNQRDQTDMDEGYYQDARRDANAGAESGHHEQMQSNEDAWNQRYSDRDESPYRNHDSQYYSEYHHTDRQHDDHPRHYPEDRYERQSYYPEHHITQEARHQADQFPAREPSGKLPLNHNDLQDIEFTPHSNRARKLMAYGGVFAMLALIGLLAWSSIPDLSPVEIIAMDGYEGEQPTKTPFNLASLHDCDVGTECAEALKAKVTPVTAESPTETITQATTDIAPDASTQTTTTAITTRIIQSSDAVTNFGAISGEIEFLEIPAANTRPTVNSSDAQINDTLIVLQQWSNVRGRPDIYGKILVSLAEGKTVTKIGQTGRWIEVRVDERPSVTGYMHRSTVTLK